MAGEAKDLFAALSVTLSGERLAPYLASSPTEADALALYEWNMAVSAALFETFAVFEVCLRNALHTELTRWNDSANGTGEWFDHLGLSTKGAEAVDTESPWV